MNVTEALAYIHSVSWKGSIPGLSRTQELLAKMGSPEKQLKFIHVAGTNGKGSTAAMLASILQTAGYTTGLYTSPFISRFHERMQVNGVSISDEELATITEAVEPLAESMEDHPTEFELVSCIAFEYFMEHSCDIVVLEVGMGGELDSTNVIDTPEAAVICNIGLDHMEVLGDTVEKIASAKAGIIKKGGDAVIYREKPSVEAVFEDKCRAVGARLTKADFDSLRPSTTASTGRCSTGAASTACACRCWASISLKTRPSCSRRRRFCSRRAGGSRTTTSARGSSTSRGPAGSRCCAGTRSSSSTAATTPSASRRSSRTSATISRAASSRSSRASWPTRTTTPCIPASRPTRRNSSRSRRSTRAPCRLRKLAEYLGQFGKPVTTCLTVADGVMTAIDHAGPDGTVLAYGSLYMVGDIQNAVRQTIL
jgi:dihydrofolate synthase/folylpolyglutamate synthase